MKVGDVATMSDRTGCFLPIGCRLAVITSSVLQVHTMNPKPKRRPNCLSKQISTTL